MERILIASLQLNKTNAGKPVIDLFGTDTRLEYPVLRLFDLNQLRVLDLDPNNPPTERTYVNAWAYYETSDKKTSTGRPYRDLRYLEPIDQPATATSVDTSAQLEEIRKIRLYVQAIVRHLQIPLDTPNGTPLELCPDCHTRPCICDQLGHDAGDTDADPQPDQPDDSPNPEPEEEDPILRYASGQPVSDNQAEIDAYLAFLQAEHVAPLNIQALRVWCKYQEQARPNGNGKAVRKTAN